MKRLALPAILLMLAVSPALPWSNKEHILMTRIAAIRSIQDPATPQEMKTWLTQATELTDWDRQKYFFLYARVGIVPPNVGGIAYWSTMPDMFAMIHKPDAAVAPFGVPERVLHYIDLEYFAPRTTTRPAYADDLSLRPSLSHFPRNISDPRYQQAGMLPWRVQDCYRKLLTQIRSGRLMDKPGQYPRDEHAAKWAGMLAHYLEDNTQPHHATIDYKSRAYLPTNATALDVHQEMEYRLLDDPDNDFPQLRQQLWDLFLAALDHVQDPAKTTDPWLSTLEIALDSYNALPLIGHAAAHAITQPDDGLTTLDTNAFFLFKGNIADQEMTVLQLKARQMALAVIRVQKLWRLAWDQARAPQSTESEPMSPPLNRSR